MKLSAGCRNSARSTKRLVSPDDRCIEEYECQADWELMTDAQTFLTATTPACPEELTAPVLHRVLDYEHSGSYLGRKESVLKAMAQPTARSE
jgi:hypothetical protein